ncbi:hypothetical protein HZA43_03960 [Candidatus Peregrinibacteria bacterium]|nr:hypothetical protein [Candidatus Peregrinibacteria bacterium]
MAIIATITPEQLNGLTEKSDSIPLRPKQGEDAMEKTFDGKLPKEKPEVKEGKTKALTKFITEKDIGTTKQIPDAACEAVVKYLATRYEVTQEAADKPLKIDGTEIRDMDALMPKLDGLKGSDQKLPANLTEAAQKGTATTEQLGHIRDYLKQVKAEGDEKPKGWMDNIGELFSAITQLIAAWKSQDFDTLGDVAKDLQAGKNPLEEQQKASDTYRTILEHRSPAPNLNAMLAAYANPRGAEAKNLFGSKNTRLNDAQANTPNSETRYRTAAKEAIKKHLEDKLGVAIDENSVSRGTNGAMRLTYQKDDVKYRLDVSQGADRKIRVIKTTVGANGTETKNDAYDLTDIDAVNQFIAATDLNSFNANKVTLVATPAPAAAEAPPQQNQSRGRIAPAE